jgi:hypothetical protein
MKREPKTDFEKRLRKWMGSRLNKEAADELGVELSTLQNWLYHGVIPSKSKCLSCIEKIINQ